MLCHVLLQRASRQSGSSAGIKYRCPHSFESIQEVAARGQFGEPLGEPWHEVFQFRIATIVFANESSGDGIRSDPYPLRVSVLIRPETGALCWVTVRPCIGRFELNTEQHGQAGFYRFDTGCSPHSASAAGSDTRLGAGGRAPFRPKRQLHPSTEVANTASTLERSKSYLRSRP